MATPEIPPKLIEIQRQIEAEATEIKKIEQEYQKVVQGKRSLVEKKNENEMVLNELNLCDANTSVVYKLVGPILAK